MKLLIVWETQEKKMPEDILRLAEERYRDYFETVVFEILECDGSNFTKTDLDKKEADLLLTFNLKGFEQCTLTDGLAYNLLNAKQIHILLEDPLPNESCLSKQLSIAMFFYCADEALFGRLKARYPEIPWLKAIKGWSFENTAASAEKNAGILCEVIREVAEICHLS